MAFVIAQQAKRRIGEPDGPVGLHHYVVRRIERFVVEAVGDRRNGAVVFRTRDTAAPVFAGNQTALPVTRIAVRKSGRFAEYADDARLLLPFEHAIIGDVAPQQIAPVTKPYRPFAPAEAVRDPFDRRRIYTIPSEALVENLDGGIRVTLAWLPRNDVLTLQRGAVRCHFDRCIQSGCGGSRIPKACANRLSGPSVSWFCSSAFPRTMLALIDYSEYKYAWRPVRGGKCHWQFRY